MRNIVIALGLAIITFACRPEFKEEHVKLQAEINFSAEDIRNVEIFMEQLAKEWGMEYRGKEKEQLRAVYPEEETFFGVLSYKKDPVLVLTNTLPSDELDLSAFDFGKLPKDELDKLVSRITLEFENRFDLVFEDAADSAQ